jgi:hypothetical protein
MFDMENLVFGNDDLIVDFEKARCVSRFVEGRSVAYNIEAVGKSKEDEKDCYRWFLSDSQEKQRARQVVGLRKYKIFEVKFEEEANK